jgi:hypothetical protein
MNLPYWQSLVYHHHFSRSIVHQNRVDRDYCKGCKVPVWALPYLFAKTHAVLAWARAEEGKANTDGITAFTDIAPSISISSFFLRNHLLINQGAKSRSKADCGKYGRHGPLPP